MNTTTAIVEVIREIRPKMLDTGRAHIEDGNKFSRISDDSVAAMRLVSPA